jgi:hypothetical protein
MERRGYGLLALCVTCARGYGCSMSMAQCHLTDFKKGLACIGTLETLWTEADN